MSAKQKIWNKRAKQTEQVEIKDNESSYLWKMSFAPKIDESYGIIQNFPLIFFTSIIIVFVRAVFYKRSMEQFYWAIDDNLVDFFSYYKMVAIIICAVLVCLLVLYRAFAQSLAIKKTFAYIPIAVYMIFIILSYVFSDYKDFSLLGMNDRFEGTLVLLSYMAMLLYVINTVNNEKNVKYILYSVAAVSFLLGLLGISQAIGHDFFRTRFAGMLITPKEYWDSLDALVFTFKKNQIYQTVYNINYVSFYLTLLLPVFGLLFINSLMRGNQETLIKKIIWGMLFSLLLFNMIGSASSGGYLGIGVALVVAIIVLNKKILLWWRPVAVLLVITLIVGGITFDKWLPELRSVAKGAFISGTQSSGDKSLKAKSYIDYMEVIPDEDTIKLSIDGNELTFVIFTEKWPLCDIYDADGYNIELVESDREEGSYALNDERFRMCAVKAVKDMEGYNYFIIITDDKEWVYLVAANGTYYLNYIGKIVDLEKIEAIGWKNHQHFGSGRGYIWSRTLPMMKDTVLIGHGADTFCLYFPNNDDIGKYNAGFKENLFTDKPHNMYMNMAVGTGGISEIAFLVLLIGYFVQSIKIYRRREFDSFLEFSGFGIFLGVFGFAFSGLVNDSTVSVMPMFYGLLGTGISINLMMKSDLK